MLWGAKCSPLIRKVGKIMSIKYTSRGYNVVKLDISTKLVAGSTVTIGTQDDYDAIMAFAESGIMRVKCVIDMGATDADFDGCVVCNKCQNGIEFSTITFYDPSSPTGGSPIIVGGQMLMDGTALKCHVTATPPGN